MSQHQHREQEKIKTQLLALSAVVEDRVWRAVKSVQENDGSLADSVISADEEIDQLEVELEEECLKFLALYQPVAIDLRFIVAVLKINSDLERIGDLAVNIAERATVLSVRNKIEGPFDLSYMAERVRWMLRSSLDALVNLNTELAQKVCAADDEIDEIYSEMYEQIKKEIHLHPDWLDILIQQLSVSRHLERMADHATNIAEDVVYLIEGEITRHNQ